MYCTYCYFACILIVHIICLVFVGCVICTAPPPVCLSTLAIRRLCWAFVLRSCNFRTREIVVLFTVFTLTCIGF
ncbi:hypothetical protein Hanom_Chr03g00183401 [Helianthus anomalus]